jgi:hypothetical protein
MKLKMYVSKRMDLARVCTKVEDMETLSKDRSKSVRWCLMLNEKTTTSIVERLVKDGDEDVRNAAVKHGNMSIKMMMRVARCNETALRRSLLANPSISRDVVEVLSHDKSPWVVERAYAHHLCDSRMLLDSLRDSRGKRSWRYIINSEKVDARILKAALDLHSSLREPDKGIVLSDIACHSEATEEILKEVWERGCIDTRKLVLEHPNASHEIIMNACSNEEFFEPIMANSGIWNDFAKFASIRMELAFHEWMSKFENDSLKQLTAVAKYQIIKNGLGKDLKLNCISSGSGA